MVGKIGLQGEDAGVWFECVKFVMPVRHSSGKEQ